MARPLAGAHRPGRVRPSTLAGYESKAKVHIKPAVGHVQLERLQPEHLEAFYAARIDAGAAPGVRHARLHDARHTAATLLLAQGIPARVVMEILGHSTVAVTQNIYGHVMPEAVTAATTAVADVLFAPEATTVAPHCGAASGPRDPSAAGQRGCRP